MLRADGTATVPRLKTPCSSTCQESRMSKAGQRILGRVRGLLDVLPMRITPKTRRETPNREEREHPHLSISTSSFCSRDFAIESTMFRLRVGKGISSLPCFRSRGPGNHPRRFAILPWATKVVSAALPRVAPHVGLTKHEKATTSCVIMLGASFN